MTKALIFTLFLASVVLSASAQAVGDTGDEWDVLDASQAQDPEAVPPQAEAVPVEDFMPPPRERSWEQKAVFGIMIGFLMASLVASILGARSNAKRTLAFEEQFCLEPEGLLYKQFTRLGKGPNKLLVSNGSSIFKLHANGHRHLEGAVVTMTLLRRHELVSHLMQMVMGQEEVVCLELYVKEGSMPPMVLAIATPSTYKELVKNNEDLAELATRLEVKEDKIKDWPSKDLVVFSEHPSYLYDMMTKPMLAQIFGAAAFEKQKKHFRGMHITSDSNNTHSKVMRFWFAVPKAEKMAELTTLMTFVFAMVSQVGSYSISAERQKQAEQARQTFAKKFVRVQDSSNHFAKEVADSKKLKKRR